MFKTFKDLPSNSEISEYLRNVDGIYDKFIMKTVPIRPLAGQLFLYKSNQVSKTISISDQYRWKSSDARIDEENQIKTPLLFYSF